MKGIRGFLDLWAAAGLACAAVAVTSPPLDGSVAVRTLFALPLVLLLPGYALLAALLPRLERWSADGLAFSLGLSVSVTILTGLALNFTRWGLERRSISITLAAVTLVSASAAAVLRLRSAEQPEPRRRIRATAGQLVLFTLALLTVAAAVGIARLGAVQAQRRSTFTQLWMLPPKGSAETGTSLQVGIRNDEGSRETYRLLVRAGKRRVASWASISLASGKQWVDTLELPDDLPARTPVKAELFRKEHPETVYRHVTFWPSADKRTR